MNGSTYKILLIIIAIGTVIGGTGAFVDSRVDRALKPIEKDIQEIKVDVKEIGKHLKVWK